MLCAAHFLPLRPCLWASRAAVTASHASEVGKVWKHARPYSPSVCTTVQASKNSANTWEQDLADVLQEPESKVQKERADKPLQSWQTSRLHAAAAAGRRKVKVNDLAHELQLPRPEVLKFLKTHAPHTDRSGKIAEAAEQHSTDAGTVEPSMQDLMWDAEAGQQPNQSQHDRRTDAQAMPQPRSKKSQPSIPFVDRQRQGSDFDNKRLGRAVEATLERLYEETRWPSDEMLQSVLQLHKGLPRRKLVDWFGQRRRMEAATDSHSRRQRHKAA